MKLLELVRSLIRTVLAVQMGAMMAGQFSALTPDYVKAKVAAGRLFKLFDRIPLINSDSDEGLHPVSRRLLLGLLHFLYPNLDLKPLLGQADSVIVNNIYNIYWRNQFWIYNGSHSLTVSVKHT